MTTCAKTRCTRPATHAFRLLGPKGYARLFCAHHARQDARTLTAGGHQVWTRPLDPQPVVEGVSPAS